MDGHDGRMLIITADDFGLHQSYDRGILEAARSGAIDAAGVMVNRTPAMLEELLATGIAVGLHLEAPDRGSEVGSREATAQLARFERLAGKRPDFIDGHHHCHAGVGAAAIAALAARCHLPVRSVDDAHRRLLHRTGVTTPDLLVGRLNENEAIMPPELSAPPADARVIEWMVHPGYPDPQAGSSYDRGRGEDLRLLLRWTPPAGMKRADHRRLNADGGSQ